MKPQVRPKTNNKICDVWYGRQGGFSDLVLDRRWQLAVNRWQWQWSRSCRSSSSRVVVVVVVVVELVVEVVVLFYAGASVVECSD